MELSHEETQLVLAHRDRVEAERKAQKLSLRLLQIASEYEGWLQQHGFGSTYSTFCDFFQIQELQRPRNEVFKAVEEIRRCSLSNAA